MKRVLMISYSFPPKGGGGVLRQTKFAKYLPEFNWHPFILTGRDHFFFQDEELLREVESSCKIFRVPHFDPRLILKTKRGLVNSTSQKPQTIVKKIFNIILISLKALFGKLAVPDPYIGWAVGAVKKALTLIRSEKIDLIYSIDNPCSNHLLAFILRRMTGIPWVADFKDPWTAGFNRNASSKIFPLSRLDYVLQRNILRHCDGCVSSDRRIDKILKSVLGGKLESKFHIVFNGFDKEDFNGKVEKRANATLTVSHIGTIYRDMPPFTFLEAIVNLLKRGLIQKDDIRLQFVGVPEYPEMLNCEVYQKLLRMGIIEYIGPVSHKTSIKYMMGSDALLLISANVIDSEDIIPSKTFEYIASGTPIIVVADKGSDVSEIVLKTHSGYKVSYNDIGEMERLIVKLTRQIKRGPLILPQDKKYISFFDRKNSTGRLSEIFDSLTLERVNKSN